MSKRHYRMLPDGSYLCVSCRQEFSNRKELGKHYGIHGQCHHPIALGMHLDIETGHRRWTNREPVRLSEAA